MAGNNRLQNTMAEAANTTQASNTPDHGGNGGAKQPEHAIPTDHNQDLESICRDLHRHWCASDLRSILLAMSTVQPLYCERPWDKQGRGW